MMQQEFPLFHLVVTKRPQSTLHAARLEERVTIWVGVLIGVALPAAIIYGLDLGPAILELVHHAVR